MHLLKVEFHSLQLLLFQTIMSAFWQAGRLGLSFYDVESASLRFMPDSAELEDFQLMSRGRRRARIAALLPATHDHNCTKGSVTSSPSQSCGR